ncbi:unnamed protein product [Notodromas monacha]|uniref:Uncharacterized protein n=1 Tax=Notodromas monacha TaxID=399045 RepID=A0A7R9BG40_9CRUS|nr:unnamed protein product [Notodromas monacha]CAG0914819.1 unnamed protein product [Notodromas monacha]
MDEQSSITEPDPDVVVRRQEEMEAARQRLQAQYDERARVHAERMKEKEEKNRATAVSEWEKHQGGQGYRSKVKASEEQEAAALRAANELNNVSGVGSSSSGPSSRPARRMRPEFNPLMGQGTSRFTPTPRGNVGGG